MSDIVDRLLLSCLDKDNCPRMSTERAAPVSLVKEAVSEIARLRAENERLRAALETISLMDKKHEHDLFSATQVARAALEAKRISEADGQPAPGKEEA